MERFKQWLNEEKKVTKKDFMSLHKANKIGLIQGGVKMKAKEVFNKLKSMDLDKIKLIKLSRATIDDARGVGTTIKIFHDNINGKDIFVVEETFDNSKDPNVSWNTLDFYSTVYMVK